MIDGTYFALLPTPGGARAHSITLRTDHGLLTGTVTNARAAAQISDGRYQNDNFSFQVQSGPQTMHFQGTADDGGLNLTWSVANGTFHVRADRSN